MHAAHCDDPPAVDEADPDALRRMRLAIADATFVAEGLTLGLLQRWAERAPPFDDLPPPVMIRPTRDGRTRMTASHRLHGV